MGMNKCYSCREYIVTLSGVIKERCGLNKTKEYVTKYNKGEIKCADKSSIYGPRKVKMKDR